LSSFGIDKARLYRLAASYVRPHPKGEQTADLPVQDSDEIRKTVSNQDAKALGLESAGTCSRLREKVLE